MATSTTVETRAKPTGQSFVFDASQLMTPQEVAECLRVPVSWVYEKTRRRSHDPLPTVRLGKYLRFHWPDVAAWLERHRTNGA
ncbi:MAG TPA: helix-turn-helix domain-containing protein [Candidatus Acidoferrales bacterium]|nr:helix-turn-helix domain-containing protein [Candidatus Acidoferrales bacterium]